MSKFFIRRPIVAIVIAIITVVVGLVSLLTLPISQYPNIVPPEILVTATYPGADAKTVSQAVSTPLEQQMNGVDNMIYMDSVSANNGVAQIFVDFDVKTATSGPGYDRRPHCAESADVAAHACRHQLADR
jgi:HAE1 family hydrophobic/amphiphilic exporter-1